VWLTLLEGCRAREGTCNCGFAHSRGCAHLPRVHAGAFGSEFDTFQPRTWQALAERAHAYVQQASSCWTCHVQKGSRHVQVTVWMCCKYPRTSHCVCTCAASPFSHCAACVSSQTAKAPSTQQSRPHFAFPRQYVCLQDSIKTNAVNLVAAMAVKDQSSRGASACNSWSHAPLSATPAQAQLAVHHRSPECMEEVSVGVCAELGEYWSYCVHAACALA